MPAEQFACAMMQHALEKHASPLSLQHGLNTL